VRVRSVTVVGLLILTTALTIACGAFGLGPTARPTDRPAAQPSPSATGPTGGTEPEASPTLPVTGTDDPGPGADPGASAAAGQSADPEASDDPNDEEDTGNGGPGDLGDPFGRPDASYHTGTATLTIGERVITLDRLAGTGSFFNEFGADIIWTGDDGWYVQVGGAKSNIGPLGIPAYVSLDWVHDGQHWVSWDANGCEVMIIQADPAGVRGVATCKDMRWVDAIAGNLADEPTPIAGQPAFGVMVQFVARP
jgi:hypothetical protein